MIDQLSYEAILEELGPLDDDEMRRPGVPVEVYIHEALRLHDWARDDLQALTGAGMPIDIYEALPVRSAALRHAESLWANERFVSQEAQLKWNEESKEAYELRNNLLHALRFAFRRRSDLKQVVDQISEGNSHVDMLQDLKALVVAGRRNEALLAEINFDMARLERCELLAEKLGMVYAEARNDRLSFRQAKLVRDKIFALLKESVDEVRAFGQYVFWRDGRRKVGYTSEYHRIKGRVRTPTGPQTPPQEPEEPQEPPATPPAGEVPS